MVYDVILILYIDILLMLFVLRVYVSEIIIIVPSVQKIQKLLRHQEPCVSVLSSSSIYPFPLHCNINS
jgi:hypothetical protein